MMNFAGIDFGAKTAGTTSICWQDKEKLFFAQSSKGKDADEFLLQHIRQLHLKAIYIDAPLSLPSAYFGKGDNFSHRECDVLLNAMSPMFLGGLTARAIRLRYMLSLENIVVNEVYPSALVRSNDILKAYYDKKSKTALDVFSSAFIKLSPIYPVQPPDNWHQADSWLAWYSGYRHMNNIHTVYGSINEGIIIV